LETLQKEFPELRAAWEQGIKDGQKPSEILSWYEAVGA
jgi:hypothetical protein